MRSGDKLYVREDAEVRRTVILSAANSVACPVRSFDASPDMLKLRGRNLSILIVPFVITQVCNLNTSSAVETYKSKEFTSINLLKSIFKSSSVQGSYSVTFFCKGLAKAYRTHI